MEWKAAVVTTLRFVFGDDLLFCLLVRRPCRLNRWSGFVSAVMAGLYTTKSRGSAGMANKMAKQDAPTAVGTSWSGVWN